MKGKTKYLLPIVAGLLTVPLLGCTILEPLTSPSALNRSQAIGLVIVAGVSYIDDYYVEAVGEEAAEATGKIGYVTPTGDWTADYQGDGVWIVRGDIITTTWGECSTTWRLEEKATAEIKLIEINCE